MITISNMQFCKDNSIISDLTVDAWNYLARKDLYDQVWVITPVNGAPPVKEGFAPTTEEDLVEMLDMHQNLVFAPVS